MRTRKDAAAGGSHICTFAHHPDILLVKSRATQVTVGGCIHEQRTDLCCHIFYTVLPVQLQQFTIQHRLLEMFCSCSPLVLLRAQIPVGEMVQALEVLNSIPEVDST